MKHMTAPCLLHGGDYNPEQWLASPQILEQDIELMKQANINTVTLGVFSWSSYEPEEGHISFDWLDQVTDRLWEAGISFILATPTGARPAWMDKKYPEIMRTDSYGVRNHHGLRHNHCMSSEIYREKAADMDRLLARRYGSHPGLRMWHISNEFSGECFCPQCQEKFRTYLKEKYHTIEHLNACWWTSFWSHTYHDFDEIEAPMRNGETGLPILSLEWRRFTTWNTVDFMKQEIRAIRESSPDIPVTTNFMWLYPLLDYREFSDALDFVSWDAYPRWHNDYEPLEHTAAWTAFNHSLMRNICPGKPFFLMEHTPSAANGHLFSKLKRPGMGTLATLQAIACGSDSALYFQWRKGRGGFEQYHGAVVDHDGRNDTRVFAEVSHTGQLLSSLDSVPGSTVTTKAAILYEWENAWALDASSGLGQNIKYNETCVSWYQALLRQGIDADIIGRHRDLSGYQLVIAPMMYICRPEQAKRLREYVEQGGCLIATYLSAYVDETLLCHLGGFPGCGLSDLFGIRASELDTLYPSDRNRLIWNGRSYEIRDYCEILKNEDAEILASYQDDFYQNTPALTQKSLGAGTAIYLACRTEQSFLDDFISDICRTQNLPCIPGLVPGTEYHLRSSETQDFHFYLNFTDKEQTVDGHVIPAVSGLEVTTEK